MTTHENFADHLGPSHGPQFQMYYLFICDANAFVSG